MTASSPTVGILYPGEMGSAVASFLRARGLSVVSTLHGRGSATAANCRAAGVNVLDSFAEVVRRSDLLIALVVPSAAETVAAEYCAAANQSPPGSIYMDVNSIAPDRARAIASRVEAAGREFVDASINGLAKNLTTSGTLYLSGGRAADVGRLFHGIRVENLGHEPGRASAMKMLLGGLSKGLCALFAELSVVAQQQGMLEEMLEATRRTYGGVAEVAERMLPTYPRHAARRATEMAELESTVRAAGLTPDVVSGILRFHQKLANIFPDGATDPSEPVDLPTLIRHIADRIEKSGVM